MPNLNAESHFAQSPLGVDVKRSVFDRSFNHKCTFNPGKLNVLMADEILPGDDVAVRVSELVRAATPLVPVADDCYLDLFAFFEPYRLDWIHWKEFNGENNASDWIQTVNYTVPSIPAFGSYRSVGDAGHQMGIPPLTSSSLHEYSKVHVLELRALRRVYNDWFRDQNTQAPLLINTGDTETDTTLFQLPNVDRIHDYFGSCLPGPQKGAAVKIALSGFMNVYPTSDSTKNLAVASATDVSSGGIRWQSSMGVDITANASIGTASVQYNGNSGSKNDSGYSAARPIPVNLIADGNHSSNDFGIDVNALRLAVQTQRILEKLSIGGEKPVAA